MAMSRTTATFSVSLPPQMAKELERVRKSEHRTRSELVREALRGYIRRADSRTLQERAAWVPEQEPTADEREAIEGGMTEFRVGNHVAFSELRHEPHVTRKQPRAKKS
jgi:Arc/MetJ-type ribon-helix-helix transcriptional regulator